MEFQIRKLIKSFPKFSNQIERINIVAEGAKLKDKNIDDLKKLGKLLIERAKAATIIPLRRDQSGEVDKKPYREPVLKVAGFQSRAKSLFRYQKELELLAKFLPKNKEERKMWIIDNQKSILE
ncbi:uncharacterized protein LOC136039447 isoform X2 [Artemia franciscana]|uniref:uncharacterized protein LOC136039447 isoform X2 n=1 Tax=Artemia franciscana TaxID=6661 RepID=UPI0032D9ECE9